MVEPPGGGGSDGCVRCYGTNVRPSLWSWLRPFTTAGVGGLGCTKAYGHRGQPARVLPSSSTSLLMMAGPWVGGWLGGGGKGGGGERLALEEPRPPEGTRRHTGSGYELVLDPVVPQLGRDVKDWPPTIELYWWEQVRRYGAHKDMPESEVVNRVVANVQRCLAEP